MAAEKTAYELGLDLIDELPAAKPAVRGQGGKFLPGHAGLPGSGRPKGTSQATLVRELIEPHREALITRALELTKNPDPFAAANALRICLERLAPAPKQESEKIEVPGLAEAEGFADKCEAVIKAVAGGDISAEAGERVLRLLDVYRRAHETDNLERRLAALEAGRIIEGSST